MKDESKSTPETKEEELIETTETGSVELEESHQERVSGGVRCFDA